MFKCWFIPIVNMTGSFKSDTTNNFTLIEKCDLKTQYSIQEISKQVYDAQVRKCNDHCTNLKNKLAEHYKTNIFDNLPCKKHFKSKEDFTKYIGTDEHQDSFILEDIFKIMIKIHYNIYEIN